MISDSQIYIILAIALTASILAVRLSVSLYQ
uniref:Photosystem I reaction center subunit XII n=1 Tax=Actinocyclus subtilis TaxID=1630683 RepID=A0A2U9NQ21_9STRA|nr:photosystem I protein M [Actinocyclus subtilis]AWT39211.1 photosystem I protein M [Actinocyclus subtilis]